ncbi:phage tail tip fiber protein [Plesiomonas shigelloides]|uniref:phage tail tip fiber protein n=1 Tax=Plesiomonas shigelloides TaxID=703 RepID=UPI003EBC99A0
MAKHDWKALQAEFLEEHRESGITAQEWCSQRGINYQSARRYIKVRNVETAQLHKTAQSAQNRTAQSTSTAHSAVSAQELLKPIESVPQLGQSVTEISSKLPSLENAISSLDQRQKDAEDSLKEAQDQLGDASINIGLVQDRLNKKIDKYKGDFDTFRDAVFVVDPENGNITMDAVNAVREEMRTSISEVQMELDAVSGQINQKADNVVVDKHGSRLTEAEERINGLDASLSQTVTKGEFTEEQKKVTQIGQELNATKGELAQKATKQEVDSQGERLANAENKLNVQTDELSSQAQRIDALQATVKDGDSTLDARITELAKVTADQDKVIAEQVGGLSVRTDAAESSITDLKKIVSNSDGVSLDRFDSMQAELDLTAGAAIEGALADDERDKQSRKAFGAIRTEQKVILTEQSAQAQRISDMNVKFEGVNADTQARISSVEQVLSDEDKALAGRMDSMEADYKQGDADNIARIESLSQVTSEAMQALTQRQDKLSAEVDLSATTAIEGALSDDERDKINRKARGKILTQQETLANQQEAMAKDLTMLSAAFEAESAALRGEIVEERKARTTANEAMASKIEQVTATFTEADNALSSQITTESESRATADEALGKLIETVTATAGELDAAVQQQSQAIASLEKGAQAMWTAKAQAGDVKAGIGLVAKSDGTSQVVISASQTFVFDPNKPDALTPLLAIDQGKVIIPEALIKKATIQIIHSEKITADYIKAGVSISAPAISGGSFDMGNAYMSGGAAGFGLGGPYSGWGKGWNSIIYSDGSIYTNRLNAEGGNVRNMRIGSCVIDENCDVRGTLYANKIVGDVTKAYVLGVVGAGVNNSLPSSRSINIPPVKRSSYISIPAFAVFGFVNYGERTAIANATVSINGTVFGASAVGYSGCIDISSASIQIPANTPVTVSISARVSDGMNTSCKTMPIVILQHF